MHFHVIALHLLLAALAQQISRAQTHDDRPDLVNGGLETRVYVDDVVAVLNAENRRSDHVCEAAGFCGGSRGILVGLGNLAVRLGARRSGVAIFRRVRFLQGRCRLVMGIDGPRRFENAQEMPHVLFLGGGYWCRNVPPIASFCFLLDGFHALVPEREELLESSNMKDVHQLVLLIRVSLESVQKHRVPDFRHVHALAHELVPLAILRRKAGALHEPSFGINIKELHERAHQALNLRRQILRENRLSNLATRRRAMKDSFKIRLLLLLVDILALILVLRP
mmetsp:Transcript_3354/g.8687  ORF Transcript_3354/g.8687 Transcript_3354/m.8687 type:complete len:280 (+) Transcript_3354:258-1097(+)